MTLSAEDRARERELRAELRALSRPQKEAARLERRAQAKLRKAERPKPERPGRVKVVRERDMGFLSWLHDLPCIACSILGRAPREHAYIEAAHQKAQDAGRGWNKRLGVRPSDEQCCPLCAWHHRLAPTCCDPAQAKFWDLLGVDVIAFCQALYAAYREGLQGSPVVQAYATKATKHHRERNDR